MADLRIGGFVPPAAPTPPTNPALGLPLGPSGAAAPSAHAESFLGGLFSSTNDQLNTASAMSEQLAAGQQVDLAQVTAANEQAGLALDLLLQVRNKLVDGLNEVLRTQV